MRSLIATSGSGSGFFQGLANWLAQQAQSVLGWWKGVAEWLWRFISTTVQTVWDWFVSVFFLFGDTLNGMWAWVIQGVAALLDIPYRLLDWGWERITGAASAFAAYIGDKFPALNIDTGPLADVADAVYGFGYFIPVTGILAVVLASFTFCGLWVLGKYIWRSIPGMG